MIKYLIGVTDDQSKACRRGLYMLSKPFPDPADKTLYLDDAYPNPVDGTFAIKIDLGMNITVDRLASAPEFVMPSQAQQEAWMAFVSQVTAEEYASMAGLLQGGGDVQLASFVPSAIVDQLVDEETARNAGYEIPVYE